MTWGAYVDIPGYEHNGFADGPLIFLSKGLYLGGQTGDTSDFGFRPRPVFTVNGRKCPWISFKKRTVKALSGVAARSGRVEQDKLASSRMMIVIRQSVLMSLSCIQPDKQRRSAKY